MRYLFQNFTKNLFIEKLNVLFLRSLLNKTSTFVKTEKKY